MKKVLRFLHLIMICKSCKNSWRDGRLSQSIDPTDTCLQFVPLWNFVSGLFLITLSAWFPEYSIVPFKLFLKNNSRKGQFSCDNSSFSGEVYILASSKSLAQSHSGKLYKLVDPKRYNPEQFLLLWGCFFHKLNLFSQTKYLCILRWYAFESLSTVDFK